jgi:hypothetical protein
MTGIDVIITATIAAMTDAMIIVAMTITTGVMTAGMITVKTSATTGEMIDVMIDIAKMTIIATTIISKSGLYHQLLKGATPMGCSNRPTERSTSSSAVAKRPKAREIGHVNTKILQPLRRSEFPITFFKKDHWVHILDPGTYPLVINPIVGGAFLPKTLIDGAISLNIIFTEMLCKMDFDFNKMTTCDEPFYGVVLGKAAYPIGRVCLLVTFGTKENFRTEYLTFEVADFRSSYHAVLGRPMLAKFMAIPHHTYLVIKMPAPNEILSVLGDIMVSYNCESATVDLSKDSVIKAAATVIVTQAALIDQTTLEVPEQKRTSTALDPSPAVKKVFLGLPDASKEVIIRANLDPK